MALPDLFLNFQKFIDEEQDLRDEIRAIVRNVEQCSREIYAVLQGIHQPVNANRIPALCVQAKQLFSHVQIHFGDLLLKVPKDQYYRFHDHWRFSIQRLVFLVALIAYLEKEILIDRKDAATQIGVFAEKKDGFHLDLDDYLMGILTLADELSRFSMNCVTCGDYGRPVRIAKFVTEMNAGFRLLNLKNDSLRKRFDALKYDLKRAEEVVYDITIRGLKTE